MHIIGFCSFIVDIPGSTDSKSSVRARNGSKHHACSILLLKDNYTGYKGR